MDQRIETGPTGGDDRVTPMMAQYLAIKGQHPDCLLFYRMGDFYELFFEDAQKASRALGIVLTKRGKHGGDDIPMCGVPVERSDDYLQRLIGRGFRVAICEQTEDPAEAKRRGAKSVVQRAVVRIVTPGTITEETLLEPKRSNRLVALSRVGGAAAAQSFGLAALDLSTGSFALEECSRSALPAHLSRLDPVEIVVPEGFLEDRELDQWLHGTGAAVTPVGQELTDGTGADRRVREAFGVATLDGLGALTRAEVCAAATAIGYVSRTQCGASTPIALPVRSAASACLQIDAATRASLELIRTLGGQPEGSLLHAIDRTVTAAGGRLLAERLASPLCDPAEVTRRLDAVSFFDDQQDLSSSIRTVLRAAPDLSRSVQRLALGRGGPRDLLAVAEALGAARTAASHLRSRACPDELAAALAQLAAGEHADLAGQLSAALAEDVPLRASDGGFVRSGYDADLDEQRSLRDQSRRVIAGLQARYGDETGHRTLRIKHTNFLGYFVEVPAAAGEILRSAPWSSTFIHRQTLQGAMRFSTAELADLDSRISAAGDRSLALELAIFERLTRLVIGQSPLLAGIAAALACLDVSTALAELAREHNYTRPRVDGSLAFDVRGGRHPVVEQALGGAPFIANDCALSPDAAGNTGQIWLVTGPNMGGKSTFLRQNALIAILAQAGSFVPAASAHIGIVDRLFSRVGAADDLARGRSTFMVEMVETSAILNQATERSLVVVDEIGRGTSTFDGLSIAWAAIEHLHDSNRCRSLFATHFHELTRLAGRFERIVNCTLRVAEYRGSVVFLHEVVPGVADRSYGVQVAKLAGLPPPVVQRAKALLADFESTDRRVRKTADDLPLFAAAERPPEPQPEPASAAAVNALQALDPDSLTPRAALDALYRLKDLLHDR